MEKGRSLEAYRTIDLMLWAAILVVFEGVIVRAANSLLFVDQAFTVSLAAPIACIVYMRWGYWGGIHAALAGAVYVWMGGGSWTQLLIYAGGNLLSLAVVPVMNHVGKESVRQRTGVSLAVAAGTLVLMQLGRAMIGLCMGAPLTEAVRFFTTDALSMVFTLVIVWIARRLDGVYEDQAHYLRRFQQNQKQERTEEA